MIISKKNESFAYELSIILCTVNCMTMINMLVDHKTRASRDKMSHETCSCWD